MFDRLYRVYALNAEHCFVPDQPNEPYAQASFRKSAARYAQACLNFARSAGAVVTLSLCGQRPARRVVSAIHTLPRKRACQHGRGYALVFACLSCAFRGQQVPTSQHALTPFRISRPLQQTNICLRSTNWAKKTSREWTHLRAAVPFQLLKAKASNRAAWTSSLLTRQCSVIGGVRHILLTSEPSVAVQDIASSPCTTRSGFVCMIFEI